MYSQSDILMRRAEVLTCSATDEWMARLDHYTPVLMPCNNKLAYILMHLDIFLFHYLSPPTARLN